MRSTTALLLLGAIILTSVACGSDQQSVPTPSATLGEDKALEIANEDAGHILSTGTVESSTARSSSGNWTVVFKGRFLEPQPPPAPGVTVGAREPVCALVTVHIRDGSTEAYEIAFEPTTGCE